MCIYQYGPRIRGSMISLDDTGCSPRHKTTKCIENLDKKLVIFNNDSVPGNEGFCDLPMTADDVTSEDKA